MGTEEKSEKVNWHNAFLSHESSTKTSFLPINELALQKHAFDFQYQWISHLQIWVCYSTYINKFLFQ